MSPGKFNPENYESPDKMPVKHREKFEKLSPEEGGGFVAESAHREFEDAKRVASAVNEMADKKAGILQRLFGNVPEFSGLDVLHDAANKVPMTKGYANELIDFLSSKGLYELKFFPYGEKGMSKAFDAYTENKKKMEEQLGNNTEGGRSLYDSNNLYAIKEGRNDIEYSHEVRNEARHELRSIIENNPQFMEDKKFAKKVKEALEEKPWKGAPWG